MVRAVQFLVSSCVVKAGDLAVLAFNTGQVCQNQPLRAFIQIQQSAGVPPHLCSDCPLYISPCIRLHISSYHTFLCMYMYIGMIQRVCMYMHRLRMILILCKLDMAV